MPEFFRSSDQQAKERFKNLIVTAIENAKNYFNDAKPLNFMNAVEMVDCLLESYKEDPIFIEKGGKLLTNFKVKSESLQELALIDIDTSTLLQQQTKVGLYQQWFRLLIDLANRTVFAGKSIDVDLDMSEIFKTWRDMMNDTTITKKVIEESKSDQTSDEVEITDSGEISDESE